MKNIKFYLSIFLGALFMNASAQVLPLTVEGQLIGAPEGSVITFVYDSLPEPIITTVYTDADGYFFYTENMMGTTTITFTYPTCTGYEDITFVWYPGTSPNFTFTLEYCPLPPPPPCVDASFYFEEGDEDFVVTAINNSTGEDLSYFWSFGDGTSSNDAFPTHVYEMLGGFAICLTVTNAEGCEDTQCDSLIVTPSGDVITGSGMMLQGFTLNIMSEASLSVQEKTPAFYELAVYPNPAGSNYDLTLNASFAGPINVAIYNMCGALMSAEKFNGTRGQNRLRMDASQLNAGMYVVRCTDSSGTSQTTTLMKQ